MAKKKKKELAEADMDMTPMIDVTFLLLIFFLCLEFKTLEGKLQSNLPKDVGVNTFEAVPMEKLDIKITMDEWGTEDKKPGDLRFNLIGHKVHWNIGPVRFNTAEAFHKKLKEEVKILQQDPTTKKMVTKPITIKVGPGVTYGDVTWVIDIARHTGFEKITFGGGGGTRKHGRKAR